MTLAINCLAITGHDISPWVPILAAVLVAAGLGFVTLARRNRKSARGATMGVLAVLAVGVGLLSSLAPATSASATSNQCNHSSSAVTTASPTPTPTGTPTATPSATPTPTPEPDRLGSISGTVSKNGWALVVTSPPGVYGTRPGTDWNLPTFASVTGPITRAVVYLIGPGPDGVFDTADDTSYSTPVAADGSYSFTGLADGNYQVYVSLPDPGNGELLQTWSFLDDAGRYTSDNFGTTDWIWQTNLNGSATVTIAGGNDVTGQNFVRVNEQIKTSTVVD